MRNVGTVVRGIRTPIIKPNDDLASIVVESLLKAKESENFEFHDKDVVAITEAVVAISEGNYAKVDDIAEDIRNKFPSGDIGVVYPILSRNRFSLLLKGIARGCKHITMLLTFPSDEKGNGILYVEDLEKNNISFEDTITEKQYNELFSNYIHPFTGINMVDFYRDLVKAEGCEIDFVFSNKPSTILNYTKDVLVCDIHTRFKTKESIKNAGANTLLSLDDILTTSINGSGFNPVYGLYGSNKSTEEQVKLFPKSGETLVAEVQKRLIGATGKNIEVMVYGDGAFKDPVGEIWEFADPVVSPAYTSGLEGTPNELKLKYLSDNKYSDLSGDELKQAIVKEIEHKAKDLKGTMATQGTTPRRITDLLGSLCDLTSGSGDKGTPVVFIQGYFDNLANN